MSSFQSLQALSHRMGTWPQGPETGLGDAQG